MTIRCQGVCLHPAGCALPCPDFLENKQGLCAAPSRSLGPSTHQREGRQTTGSGVSESSPKETHFLRSLMNSKFPLRVATHCIKSLSSHAPTREPPLLRRSQSRTRRRPDTSPFQRNRAAERGQRWLATEARESLNPASVQRTHSRLSLGI